MYGVSSPKCSSPFRVMPSDCHTIRFTTTTIVAGARWQNDGTNLVPEHSFVSALEYGRQKRKKGTKKAEEKVKRDSREGEQKRGVGRWIGSEREKKAGRGAAPAKEEGEGERRRKSKDRDFLC
ncbi:hypothetical protein ACFX1Z_018668 [Malus domestica]